MDVLANHIIFIGFMGSGKSSVARRLARFEKMNCIDMDSYIEREAGMSVPRIFELEGEEGFRVRELDFLRSMLIRDRCVLSCGGGVVVREQSRELLKQLGTVVYLKVDADEAVSRISRPETRPLLSGAVPPAEILASRLAYYEETADITVDTRGISMPQVTAAAQRALRMAGKLPPSSRPQGSGRPHATSGSSAASRPRTASKPPAASRPQGSGKPSSPDRSPSRSDRPQATGKPPSADNTSSKQQIPGRSPRVRRSARLEGRQ
ncbi:MAG: shikimate kinase [Coriobacteriales bacterium]|jgi:shikimate kinase|nr:shikimate kinase [Coriobacteriales bacterium]